MSYNPSNCAPNNGNLVGLPYTEEDAKVVLLPVPWEVTVSYKAGTALASENIRNASYQLDLFDPDVPDAWKMGLYLRPSNEEWLQKSNALREKAVDYIAFIENGGVVAKDKVRKKNLAEINKGCAALKDWVYQESKALLDKGKLVGLVGGDHSTPLGLLLALGERHPAFGILHIDAHLDMREAYEGFTYSHASIFYNVLKMRNVVNMVSVGIRDWCEEEVEFVQRADGRVKVFYDHEIQRALYEGDTFKKITKKILKTLPEKVYVSFDIDGLDPKLCPGTGTPVAGGLELQQAFYILKCLVDSGRTIIGFDLNEVGGSEEWDGNVGARLLYKMANLAGMSNGLLG